MHFEGLELHLYSILINMANEVPVLRLPWQSKRRDQKFPSWGTILC